MTPASDRTFGSLAATVMSKALDSSGEEAGQQGAVTLTRARGTALERQLD